MNSLHQAFHDLGLQPGATLEEVTKRFKAIIKEGHPDRFATEEERLEATRKLKLVNAARDLLRHHFKNEHSSSGCSCEPPVFSNNQASSAFQGHQTNPRHDSGTQASETVPPPRADKEDTGKGSPESRERASTFEYPDVSDDLLKRARKRAKDRAVNTSSRALSALAVVASLLIGAGTGILHSSLGTQTSPRTATLQKQYEADEQEFLELENRLMNEKLAFLQRAIGPQVTRAEARTLQPPYDTSFQSLMRKFRPRTNH